jgi:hypothetical protein
LLGHGGPIPDLLAAGRVSTPSLDLSENFIRAILTREAILA